MLDIGWSEMLVIAAVAILVVGPRELPSMLRTFGKYAGQIRRMAGEFQSQFNDALKEAELDEVRRGIESVKSASPSAQLRKELGSFKNAGDSVKKAVEDPGAKTGGKPSAASDAPKPDPDAPAKAEEPVPASVAPKVPATSETEKKAPAAETAS